MKIQNCFFLFGFLNSTVFSRHVSSNLCLHRESRFEIYLSNVLEHMHCISLVPEPVSWFENVKIRMKHVVNVLIHLETQKISRTVSDLLLKYYYLDVRHVRGRPWRLLGLLWRWWAGGVRPGSTLCFLLESRVAKSIAFSPDATTKRDSTTAKQLRTARLTDSLTPPLRGFLFFTTPPQQ